MESHQAVVVDAGIVVHDCMLVVVLPCQRGKARMRVDNMGQGTPVLCREGRGQGRERSGAGCAHR